MLDGCPRHSLGCQVRLQVDMKHRRKLEVRQECSRLLTQTQPTGCIESDIICHVCSG